MRFCRGHRNGTNIRASFDSLFKILQVLGFHVDVPAQHIADGRVRASVPNLDSADSMFGFVIHSSAEETEDAYVSAIYRDRYYYIDDRDMNSKRLFSLIMLLYALAEGGVQQALPTLTIPTR